MVQQVVMIQWRAGARQVMVVVGGCCQIVVGVQMVGR